MTSSTEQETVIAVPRGAVVGDQITDSQDITALFSALDGSEMPVKVTLFQLGDAIGVGVYPTKDNGVVLRWDDGPTADPRVIYWRAPHCADDECGSPCPHGRGRSR